MMLLSNSDLLKIERALGIVEGFAYSKKDSTEICLLTAVEMIREIIDEDGDELLRDLKEELQG